MVDGSQIQQIFSNKQETLALNDLAAVSFSIKPCVLIFRSHPETWRTDLHAIYIIFIHFLMSQILGSRVTTTQKTKSPHMEITSVPWTLWVLLVFVFCPLKGLSDANYLIGTASYDITGPAADANMMGYANSEQIASGIHFRLRARAFIVGEPNGNRVVFVNLDACMASQLVTIKVLERLKSRYGGLYNEKNVAISGIHTHSGPGGYLQYVVYIVTSLGFVQQSFDVIVDGIENSIMKAHENLHPGSIYINTGELLDSGINRSPSAYLNNPPEERARYKYNVDKEMTLLKLVDAEWGPIGSFSWFATHGTSMGRTNALISGDNKGAAARFMEDWYSQRSAGSLTSDKVKSIATNYNASSTDQLNKQYSSKIPSIDDNLHKIAASYRSTCGKPSESSINSLSRVRRLKESGDKPQFVAAFCQSNVGDVSPNVLGAFCIDTGLPCDFNRSTCNGKNELCYGRGPGYPDEFASTRIIGERQFQKAFDLFDSAKEQLLGEINYRHVYLDFSNIEVKLPSAVPGSPEYVVKTCPAAMGFAFAAGTTDGPGAFDFKQGDNQGNPFWKLVRNLLRTPTQKQIDCQKPKPILLDTGEMSLPYPWAPTILPIQVLKIGQLVILCVPGEFTTMAGRRLREAVKEVFLTYGKGGSGSDIHVVIAGLTNTYSQYITTYEEYQIQRYEGASTLYGPHTLSAYIQEFKKLALAMVNGEDVNGNSTPPDLLNKQISLLPPVVVDSTPLGVNFGDVKEDVPKNATYKKGDLVEVTFWSSCPRNDLMTEGTFSLVEFLKDNADWSPIYDDDDFCLRFKWSRPTNLSSHSYATIQWYIPQEATSGVYRIRHFNAAKTFSGSIEHFTGTSSAFVVI